MAFVSEWYCSGPAGLCDRQSYAKLGAAGLRVEFDGAVVVAHETADDIEPQAGSLSLGLGGKERVEDAVAHVIRNAGPIIENAHDHAMVVALRTHAHPASMGHRVQGIVDQVAPY